jgi:hypothetical protein
MTSLYLKAPDNNIASALDYPDVTFLQSLFSTQAHYEETIILTTTDTIDHFKTPIRRILQIIVTASPELRLPSLCPVLSTL